MKDFRILMEEFEGRLPYMNSMPACIYIESVLGCPYSCAMCPVHFSKKKNISQELLDKISPYFKHLDILAIHGDGEPLLGDIEYFVDMSVKNDFVLHMNSTGFFLTKKLSEILLQTKLSIRFSIHAGSAETYYKIMGNKFEKVLENIEYLVKKDKERKNNSDFWFSFIVMKENINDVENFLKLAHDIGIEHVRFMKLLPNRESLKGIEMPNRDFRFYYNEQYSSSIANEFLNNLPYYKKLAESLGVRIEVGSMEFSTINPHLAQKFINSASKRLLFGKRIFPLKKRTGMCVVPWTGQLIIKQNGDVKLCCSTDFTLGNLNNTSLEEIWNCDIIKEIRNSFKKGIFPKVCEYCRGIGFEEYPKNSLLGTSIGN